MLKKVLLIFLIVVTTGNFLLSEPFYEEFEKLEEKIKQTKTAKVIKLTDAEKDKKDKNKNGFLIIPMIYYTPETDFAFGGSFLYYYRLKSQTIENRPSYFQTHFVYTLNNQIISVANAENYFLGEKLHLSERIEVSKYPDYFYGIGNNNPDPVKEKFTSLYTLVEVNVQYLLAEYIFAGAKWDFSHYDMLDVQKKIATSNRFGEFSYTDAKLKDPSLTGSRGGIASGFGLFLRFDSRDRTTYPKEGNFSTATLTKYHNIFGSDYNFVKFRLDIRQYITLYEDIIFAFQFFSEFNQGNVPFMLMPAVGGAEMLRGYPEGRYRDKNALFIQNELRFPIFWRFSGAVFFSFGDVFDTQKDISREMIKYAGGIGIRFSVDTQEKINIRMDYGATAEGGNVYFFMLEAF
jgi:outer membrane protein assembly factor BamA